MLAPFLGLFWISGAIGAALALLLFSGAASLLLLCFRALSPEQRRALARPMLLFSATTLAITVIAALFATAYLAGFYGAFPLP
jgi:hypothetical protein